VDRNRLNWEADSSFADILKNAINDWKKVKLSNVKSQNSYQDVMPKVDGVYHVVVNKKDKDFFETNRYKKISEDFQISKLKKKQDKEIVENFVDNILVPKLQEAYNKWDAAHKIIYNEKKELMWALDKKILKPWEIVTGIVERWIDSAKEYKVLVWKKWDSTAWAVIRDPQEEYIMSPGDIVYFISELNSVWKIVLKNYLPKEWDLKVGDVLSIRNLCDDGKHDYLSIKIGQYTWVFYKKYLPKWYNPEQPLTFKIKDIVKKRLIFKYAYPTYRTNEKKMSNKKCQIS